MPRPKPVEPRVIFPVTMAKSLKEAFKEACWLNGDVSTHVLQTAAREYLKKHAAQDCSHV